MNILTFDLEEWFHVFEDHNYASTNDWNKFEPRLPYTIDSLLDFLVEKDIKATFFCMGWIANQYPEIIKKISNLGFEIGSHSDLHKLAHSQTKKEFSEDLKTSIQKIEDKTGKKVESYRAPGFSINNTNLWVFEELIENGIKYDCSVFPIARKFGGISNFPANRPFIIETNGLFIKEFPMNAHLFLGKRILFSGGGFFRLLPYSIISYLMSQSDYVMTYFHLRDFDYEQPFNELGIIRKIKSKIGVKHSFKKLENLISDVKFIDLQQADKEINWRNMETVKIF